MSEEEIDPGLELILPDERDGIRDRLLWGTVLVILTLWAFSPSIWGTYLWDDPRYPLNAQVQRGNDGLYDIWFKPSRLPTADSPGYLTTPQYYPMTFTSYWLGFQAWGLDPTAEHAVNLLLQAGSALLVWEILRRLRVPGAWVAAAIFAVHPLQTESVAWLSERKNVLAGAFFFGSILTYLQFLKIEKDDAKPESADYQWYALSLLLFVAGLLSKSIVCSMPIVIAILIWWKRGRLSILNIALLTPFIILGLAMSAVTTWFEIHIVGATGPEWNHSPIEHILLAAHAIWFYVWKLLIPANLTLVYPKWALDSSQWLFVAALLIVLVILLATIRKTGRGILAAVLIFLVTLVPAMGFVNVYPMRYSYVADHFQYLSGLALIVLAVALAAHFLSKLGPSRRIVGLALAIIVIGIFAIGSWSHAHAFTDSESLWRDVIAKNPDAWLAYENLAGVLDDEAEQNLANQDVEESKQLALDEATEAAHDAQQALAINANLDASYEHWGRALLILNQPGEALDKFRKAEQLDPRISTIRNNLAATLTRLGRTAEAENEYRQALKLPANADVRAVMRVNLGRLLLDDATLAARHTASTTAPAQRKILQQQTAAAYDEARDQFYQATKDNPQDADAWFDLGVVLIRLNQNGPAFDALQQAVQIDPDMAAAHADLGMLYGVAGQYAQAGQEYAKVVHIQQDNADAYANMGILADKLQKPAESKDFFQMALKIDPKNQKALQGLDELARAATRPTTTQATSRPAVVR
jgi:tetratricopeptide (TPR) repeat protein